MGIEAVVGFNCKNNHSISSLMILKSSNDINKKNKRIWIYNYF